MAKIRYIMLNLKKVNRFTTKSINLTKTNPVSMIPPGLEQEFLNRINTAIANGELFEVEDGGINGLHIPGQFQTTPATESEEKHIGSMTYEYKTDENGNKTLYRVIKFFSDTDTESSGKVKPKIINLFPAEISQIKETEE